MIIIGSLSITISKLERSENHSVGDGLFLELVLALFSPQFYCMYQEQYTRAHPCNGGNSIQKHIREGERDSILFYGICNIKHIKIK